VNLDHWIAGTARPPAGGAYLDNIDPKDGSRIGGIARGGAADVEAAIAAAEAAPRLAVKERVELMLASRSSPPPRRATAARPSRPA
jgi:acyl-CoA reductase-like NAD-dependent aldehyde dehydrogenase